jgi:hypothetical protein
MALNRLADSLKVAPGRTIGGAGEFAIYLQRGLGAPRQLFLRIATTIFAGSSPGLIDIVGPSFGTEVLIFSAASGGAR